MSVMSNIFDSDPTFTCDANGRQYKHWHKNDGLLHRVGGPAVEWADGSKQWLVNGQRHRLDGPAVENVNELSYWVKGEYLTKENYIHLLLSQIGLRKTKEVRDIIIELFKTHG